MEPIGRRQALRLGVLGVAGVVIGGVGLVQTRNQPPPVSGGANFVEPNALSSRAGILRVELPLALPAVLAGVRIATVSTVALVTVGVVVSNGGLGQLIFEGFNNNLYRAEIFTATALCVALALVADLLLIGLERLLTPWTRASGARR